jgi:hypothetical protein
MVTFLEGPSLVPSDLIDAELDKNFGQKTVGLKGSEIDIRRCTKEDLDAINERPRAWKARASQANRASSELLLRPPNSSSCQLLKNQATNFRIENRSSSSGVNLLPARRGRYRNLERFGTVYQRARFWRRLPMAPPDRDDDVLGRRAPEPRRSGEPAKRLGPSLDCKRTDPEGFLRSVALQ